MRGSLGPVGERRSFGFGGIMQLIDLTREIYHGMPRLPNHPSIVVAPFSTHAQTREVDGYKFLLRDPRASHGRP